MKIVIQCAASKNPSQPGAGFRTTNDRVVRFVAHPNLAPLTEKYAYAHPDELSDGSQTWRERLTDYNMNYNKEGSPNPLHLMPAYQLYANTVYRNLVLKFGLEQVFIFSAGWGLITAGFLTPDYDITFSHAKNVLPYCRRNKHDIYSDICLLPDDGDSIVFLGGNDYLPLFCQLTAGLKGMKKVFFNSKAAPILGSGFRCIRFPTTQRTNWHYPCAQALMDGTINVE